MDSDRIQNWQDFEIWWRALPEEQKGAALAGLALFGLITALIANGKGRNPVGWFFIGAIFPLLGMIVALAMPHLRRPRAEATPTTVYVQQPVYTPPPQSAPAHGGTITDQIEEAKALLDDGTITKAEFEAIKAKLLGR